MSGSSCIGPQRSRGEGFTDSLSASAGATGLIDAASMVNGWNSLATRDTKAQGDLVFHALNSSAIAVHPLGAYQGVVWNFNEEAARMRGWDPDCHRQFLMDFYTGQALGSFAEGESDRKVDGVMEHWPAGLAAAGLWTGMNPMSWKTAAGGFYWCRD